MTAASPDRLLGTVLEGRYELLSVLGRGGMGSVYIAEDVHLRRRCALKVLHPHFAEERAHVERFLREAQMIARLEHPNIVDIYSFGEDPSGLVFFAMELLQGEDLYTRLKARDTRPYDIHEACLWALQLARAVGCVHDGGLIHRDLKTPNIFLARKRDGEEVVKLLDFGIARPEEGSELTRTGVLLGTPTYMSPEQIQNAALDRRTDIYSFGVLLFRLVTGRFPFTGEMVHIAMAHCQQPPPRPTELAPDAGISPALEAIILRALAKQPADRFQSMPDIEAALTDLLRDEAPELLPVSRATRSSAGTSIRAATSLSAPIANAAASSLSAPVAHAAASSLSAPLASPLSTPESLAAASSKSAAVSPSFSAAASMSGAAAAAPAASASAAPVSLSAASSAAAAPEASIASGAAPFSAPASLAPSLSAAAPSASISSGAAPSTSAALSLADAASRAGDPDDATDPTRIFIAGAPAATGPAASRWPLRAALGGGLVVLVIVAVSLLRGPPAPPAAPPPTAAANLVPDPPAPVERAVVEPAAVIPAAPVAEPAPDPSVEPAASDPSPKLEPAASVPKAKASAPLDPLKQIERKALACRRKHKAVGGPAVTIDYAIGADGTVTRSIPSSGGHLGDCLADAVKKTRFEPKLVFGRKLQL
ncbi:serine/threonine-protein kinase [Nannocystis bainbridge]|uniref:Serine/threonine-protein kinase n=1 Tax=Nannocystis bainbridge TaxID=2995303 RepID=A0ABT5E641_9BACT|nr:serine/threonine-protein kinase [Nannocystis bainbridge]MDC0720913.1 serine/threonine-protein kinase [Nannocystis bainbridge]